MRILLLTLLLASCAAQPDFRLYSLDVPSGQAGNPLPLKISVSRPTAEPGYDTASMAYTTREHEIAYYSRNRWVESPDRMLFPILVDSLSRRFETVLKAPAAADMRLETDIVMLRQEFSGNSSRIHLVIRVQLVKGEKILSKKFEALEDCTENDPYGGVIAANRAVSMLVREIARFCAEHAY